jgi:hypothetical protein
MEIALAVAVASLSVAAVGLGLVLVRVGAVQTALVRSLTQQCIRMVGALDDARGAMLNSMVEYTAGEASLRHLEKAGVMVAMENPETRLNRDIATTMRVLRLGREEAIAYMTSSIHRGNGVDRVVGGVAAFAAPDDNNPE